MAWRDWIRTVEIEPSVYAGDFSRLGEQVHHLLNAGARVFHFDVGDGHFIAPITFGPVAIEPLAPVIHAAGGIVDVHLMVSNPEHHFRQMAAAGGDSVTFHVEACDDPRRAIELVRSLGLAVGVALNPDTPIERALMASSGADLVLCMSVHPGYSGQEFIPESVERIRELRGRLPREVLVQVDGGIDHGNALSAYEAGAEAMVAGSSIFAREDLNRAYLRLVRALVPGD